MNPAHVFLTRLPEADYPADAPFHPDTRWPEALRDDCGSTNPVYSALRDLLLDMGLDADHAGTAAWNPFGELVRPGGTVLIKPNLVMHRHGFGWDWRAVIVHPSLIRVVTDYALIAVGPSGRVIIGDAPLQSCDFAELGRISGLTVLCDWYRAAGLPVELEDFRFQLTRRQGNLLQRDARIEQDETRALPVDLAGDSLLAPLEGDWRKFRVTCYDPARMQEHHCPGRHRYLIARRALEADLVISLAKPKTHRKGGITGALKNLVGINAHKDWLPHHRRGSAAEGGDEYPSASFWKRRMWDQQELVDRHSLAGRRLRARGHELLRKACSLLTKWTAPDSCHEGGWWGNDTLWRMVLDLNRILRYARPDGTMSDNVQRRIFCIGDMVIAGEQEGPLEPHERACGLILASLDPVAFDLSAATVMGFDWRKIPVIAQAFRLRERPITDLHPTAVRLQGPGAYRDRPALALRRFETEKFRPSAGWCGRIELGNG